MGLVAAIVVLVPLIAVVVTLIAQNSAITRPLSVTRVGRGRKRRLAWRLVLLAATAIAVLTGRLRGRVASDPAGIAAALVPSIALALLCIPVFVPYLVELAARNLSRGRPSWQLAVRRLQLNSSTASRACSGIAVVLAGAVALLPLLGYAADRTDATAQTPMQPGFLRIDAPPAAAANDVPELISAAVPGVAPVAAWASVTVTSHGHPIAGSIAGCATILANH